MVRLLSSLGPGQVRRRGGRLPRQQQPEMQALDYFRAVMPQLERAKAAMAPAVREAVRLLACARREAGRLDAPGKPPERPLSDRRKAEAKERIAHAAAQPGAAVNEEEAARAAEKAGKATAAFQGEQLSRQVVATIGVPLSAIEKPTRDRIPEFVARNVDLVKTLPERYAGRLQAEVERAYEEGWTPEDLAARLEDAFGATESDAARIARDQVGKLNAQVNQDRQEALGVDQYVWRTMNDDRVREEHQAREGETFAWATPPEDGHPGEAIQCRCYSEPDFSTIAGDIAALMR